MSLRAPVAHAIVISVAEVRGDTAFVRGSDAGRKQEISWEGDTVTTANGKGNFSFEGVLPDPCDEDSCIGTLTAGGDPIPVPLTFASSEPPFEPVDELVLKAEQPFSHQGDAVRAVGFVANGEGGTLVVSGGADARRQVHVAAVGHRERLVVTGDAHHRHDRPDRFLVHRCHW